MPKIQNKTQTLLSVREASTNWVSFVWKFRLCHIPNQRIITQTLVRVYFGHILCSEILFWFVWMTYILCAKIKKNVSHNIFVALSIQIIFIFGKTYIRIRYVYVGLFSTISCVYLDVDYTAFSGQRKGGEGYTNITYLFNFIQQNYYIVWPRIMYPNVKKEKYKILYV